MRRCDACGVTFSGDLDLCPLCQAPLAGDPEPSVFPRNEMKRSGTRALRVLAFATGAGVLGSLFAGYVLGLADWAVVAVCLGILTTYVFVRHALSSAPDFLRLVARYFVLLLVGAVAWFALTRNPLVATYVVPGVCLAALVCDAVLLCVFRGAFVSGYAKYLLLNVVFGLVPLAYAALGLTTWDVPAYASALVAAVLLLALVVFVRDRLASEVRKLFGA